jgi:hypothetical protein
LPRSRKQDTIVWPAGHQLTVGASAPTRLPPGGITYPLQKVSLQKPIKWKYVPASASYLGPPAGPPLSMLNAPYPMVIFRTSYELKETPVNLLEIPRSGALVGYHFLRGDMLAAHGFEGPWHVGEERTLPDASLIRACHHGYHAAVTPADAVGYADRNRTVGVIFTEVRLWGRVHEDGNKWAAQSRKLEASAGALATANVLRDWIIDVANAALNKTGEVRRGTKVCTSSFTLVRAGLPSESGRKWASGHADRADQSLTWLALDCIAALLRDPATLVQNAVEMLRLVRSDLTDAEGNRPLETALNERLIAALHLEPVEGKGFALDRLP